MEAKICLQLKNILKKENALLARERLEYRKIRQKGSLVIRQSGAQYVFTEKISDRERGITAEKEKILILARKRYLRQSIRQRDKICNILRSALDDIERSQSIKKLFPENVPELKMAKYSQETREWLAAKSSQNPVAPENLKYMTKAGIKVRSKSEMIIADKLLSFNLPFKYEASLELCGHNVYPDFTIMRQDGMLVLWENFGLMTDDAYAEKTVRKMMAYFKAGYSISRDMICTFEKDIEGSGSLEEIIVRYLL